MAVVTAFSRPVATISALLSPSIHLTLSDHPRAQPGPKVFSRPFASFHHNCQPWERPIFTESQCPNLAIASISTFILSSPTHSPTESGPGADSSHCPSSLDPRS